MDGYAPVSDIAARSRQRISKSHEVSAIDELLVEDLGVQT